MESTKSATSDTLKTPEKVRHIDGGSHRSPSWAVKTPKQIPHPPRRSLNRSPNPGRATQLPEKFDILRRIFNAMDSSLRLLRMRKSMPLFSRISAMVESMTDRRFGYGHLGQLKFLLPEEIVIERVSLLDDETRCMKRDLHVTLSPSMAITDKKRKLGHRNGATSLKELLSLRLSEFYETQPVGTEIPKAMLPEPFNQLEEDLELTAAKISPLGSYAGVSTADSCPELQPKVSSHLSRSFRRLFSGKAGNEATPASSPAPCLIYSSPEPTLTGANRSMSMPLSPPSGGIQLVYGGNQFPEQNSSLISLTTSPPECMDDAPALLPLRSWTVIPDDKPTTTLSEIVRHPSCARVLKFDGHTELANVELELSDIDNEDILDVLPENLHHLLKQNDRTTDEQAARRRAMAKVPMIFDRILYLFQSTKSSFIRREELISKLTECHSDIVDESEIEEQLKLLQEIIPEWMYEKPSPGRSVVYCVDRTLSPDVLRARIDKAG